MSESPLVAKPKSPFSWLVAVLLLFLCLGPLTWIVMLPIFRQATNSTQAKLSLENLRKLNAAMRMYWTDNQDAFPPAGTWMDKLGLYVDDDLTFASPVQRRLDATTFGYALNKELPGKKVNSVTDPSKMAMIFDSTNVKRNAEADLATLPEPGRLNNGRKNAVLFMDGRADTIGRL